MKRAASKRKLGIIAGVILAATLSAPATAADDFATAKYTWKSVIVGGGGFTPDIVFSPAEKGLVYLRTDIGGAYRWDTAARTWMPLEDALPQSGYMGVESVAPDPVDPNVVYLAAGMYHSDPAAILRSADRGKSWAIHPVPFRMGGNEPGRGVGERLAIDPNQTSILYFGSRDDGLQTSTDSGKTWTKVVSFPLPGRGAPTGFADNHTGIAFVLFDPKSGGHGTPSRTIFVGDTDPGLHHLFRSDDAGKSWQAVAGEPRADFLPLKAGIDSRGMLYITYGTSTGPNDVNDGGVFRYDMHNGRWTDITPDKNPKRPAGGYTGISVDRQHPGTLVVATMSRFNPGDTIYRSTDGGAHWHDLKPKSRRDVSASPFLIWGDPQASFGWWIAALAIDPFDSSHIAYATGATLYQTDQLSNADRDAPMLWTPWVKGMEETAVRTITSPPEGPHLLSGFYDIGGFAHDDLDISPPHMYTNPIFVDINTVDFAGSAPNIVAISGRPQNAHGKPNNPLVTLAYSVDYGHTWAPLLLPAGEARDAQSVMTKWGFPISGLVAVEPSADGTTFLVDTPKPLLTRDYGSNWTAVEGLPSKGRAVADRVNGQRFYAIDFIAQDILASTDGGAHFAPSHAHGLPDMTADRTKEPDAQWPLMATPGVEGDLWLVTQGRIYHSADGGRTFHKVETALHVDALSFGKPPTGKSYPTLFSIGEMGSLKAIWRSDDGGANWIRINDADHEYGRRFRCISGDPRIFGRVYVGTDGRGILYADPQP